MQAKYKEYLKEVGIFLGIFSGLTLVSFFPSYQLVQDSFLGEVPNLPKQAQAGEALLIDFPVQGMKVYFNNKQLSLLKAQRLLSVVGLKSPEQSHFYGEKFSEEFRWPWEHPEKQYFMQPLKVSWEPVKKISKLRIPSSIWKKVNDDHAEQKKADRAKMRKILQQENGVMNRLCWQKPLSSITVSRFGSPRRLPSGQHYFHSGLDLRAREGVPIPAGGPGRIVLAESMIVPGNVIVIDHGGGLYSRYMHLSQMNLSEGAQVNTGDIIGEAGATGRVEGPHLHWEVIWKGNHADPVKFLQAWEQICDPPSAG